jgi:hypothetical protein
MSTFKYKSPDIITGNKTLVTSRTANNYTAAIIALFVLILMCRTQWRNICLAYKFTVHYGLALSA